MSSKGKKVRRGIELYIDGKEVKGSVKSIQAEVRKLVREQELMVTGSREYIEQGKKIRNIKGILNEHRQQLNDINKTQASFLSRGVDMFNKYAASVTAIVAALTGVTLAFRSLRDERNKLEESQAGLKALTGLDDNSINWLTNQAKVLSTTMTKEGLRVRQSADEILEAYMLVGSAKPELLKNKEALAQVTEETMRLQAAAKDITLNEAVEALTLSLNQYGEGADQAARYTNVLAAGSQAGAANIASQAKSIEKAGTAAKASNISIEQTVGLIETLAYKGIKGEVAGTGIRNFLLTLKKGADDTNPSVVGLETALANLKSMSDTKILDVFKTENYTVAASLIRNAEMVKTFTEAVTDTSIAVEQSAINSSTMEAKLAQARNELKLAGIELIEKFNPAITVSTNMMTTIIRNLPQVIEWFKEYGAIILWLTAILVSHTVVLKTYNALLITKNALIKTATILKLAYSVAMSTLTGKTVTAFGQLRKLYILMNGHPVLLRILRASTYLYAAAVNTLTFRWGLAAKSMRAAWSIMAINPIAALVTVLVAAAGALILFSSRASAAAREQELLNKLTREATSSVTANKIEIEALLKVARDEMKSKEDRVKAIKKLNELSPEYLGNLTLETIGTDKAKDAVDRYIQSLINLARLEAAKNQLVQTDNDLNALKEQQEAYLNERDSFIGAVKSLPRNLGALFTGGLMETTGQHLKNEIKELEDKKEHLKKILADGIEGSITNTQTNTVVEPEIVTGENKGNDKKLAEEKRYQDELRNIKKSYLSDNDMTQSEYNRLLEEIEMQHLDRMLAIAGLEPDERAKIEQQILDQQIKFKEACAKEDADLYKSSQKEYLSKLEKNYRLEVAAETMNYYNSLMTKEEYYEKLLQLESDYYKTLISDSLVAEEEKLKAKEAIGEMEVASAELRKQKLEALEIQKNQVIGAAITGFGDTLGDFFADSENSIAEFGRNIILLALDTLEKLVLIGISQRTVENVTTLGVFGIPKAAAEAAIISAAFSAVKGLIRGFADGGYTGNGEWDKPQGIVHSNEFVANRFAVANPAVRPVLDLLDNAQRNGSIANLSSSDIAAVSGNSTAKSAVTVVNASTQATDGANNEQFIRVLNECTRTMKQIQERFKNNIKAEVTVSGNTGVRKALDDYNQLINNVKRNGNT